MFYVYCYSAFDIYFHVLRAGLPLPDLFGPGLCDMVGGNQLLFSVTYETTYVYVINCCRASTLCASKEILFAET